MKTRRFLMRQLHFPPFMLMFLAVFFAVGCNTTRFMANSMEPMMHKMNSAINKNPDIDLVRDAMPAGLVQLDGLIEASPDNLAFLVRGAEAYNGYSFVFVEDHDRDRARILYHRAFTYALRALKQNKAFADAFEGPVPEFEKALETFGKADVPALFWAANSWLSWAGTNVDDPEIFLAIPKIRLMLKRCIALDETYKYGAAHVISGVLHAARPPAFGGEPELAKAAFERAFEISEGRVLLFYLSYAQYYAYQIQDRELYEKTLQTIINAPDDLLPEMNFVNAVAKRKARRLLDNIDRIL
jgi:tetratricopeptide (TPR) repeat protein